MAKLFYEVLRDYCVAKLPCALLRMRSKRGAFAFIVHPRDAEDVYKKFPMARPLSKSLLFGFLRHFWPIVVSEVTGLKKYDSDIPIRGWIITIPLTAHQIMENRAKATRLIKRSLKIAAWNGADIVGLGALTASVTMRGFLMRSYLKKMNMKLTTGAAFTSANIVENVLGLMKELDRPLDKTFISIVGAAGAIGSITAECLAHNGARNFLLIDVDRKDLRLSKIAARLKKIGNDINVEVSHKVGDVKRTNFIVTATNAPEALVLSDDVNPGSVIVDDAQPSDVHPEIILARDDVIAVEGGSTHAQDINPNVSFGLKHKNDIFSCLAETMILASFGYNEDVNAYPMKVSTVNWIYECGGKLGFRRAEYQNFSKVYGKNELLQFKQRFSRIT